jgi:hypothetical protein
MLAALGKDEAWCGVVYAPFRGRRDAAIDFTGCAVAWRARTQNLVKNHHLPAGWKPVICASIVVTNK